MHSTLVAAGLTLLACTAQASLYTKSSPVIQVEAKDYGRLIANSNYTSVVEFYAPWCGHCKNLKPAYEKAAKNLQGLAKVAAVNCDEDVNKPLCQTMGVQGFPTLKIVRPSKKPGKAPIVEDYNGPRTATGVVDAVLDKINNHVRRVTDKDLDEFLAENKDAPKAILFTEKGTTSPLLKGIAIDFLDVISVAQIRNKETKAVETFGVTKFPTLVLLPGGEADSIIYDGELKKASMVEFLSQAGAPNPDPAPIGKSSKPKSKPKAEKKPEKAEEPVEEAAAEEVPVEKPVVKASAPAIPTLVAPEDLNKACLGPKTGTCVLAFVPSEKNEAADHALDTLATLVQRYSKGKGLFPFFAVPGINPAYTDVKSALSISSDVAILAVNAKRGWWRQYEGEVSLESLEGWVDAIRMSEGKKEKLPESLIVATEEAKPQEETEAAAEAASEEPAASSPEPEAASPEPEAASPESDAHDEL